MVSRASFLTRRCGPNDFNECLVAIDGSTGAVKSSMFTNYTIFRYGREIDSNGEMLVWLQNWEFCLVGMQTVTNK